jgi:hypothetical protein
MTSAMKRVALVAVAGLSLWCAAKPASAGEAQVRTARPAQGLVLDVGSKHTVSYFLAEGGNCNLTLMVGEKANEEGDNSSLGARLRIVIDAGKSARIETAESRSLEFACAADASALSVTPLDVVAYSAPKR